MRNIIDFKVFGSKGKESVLVLSNDGRLYEGDAEITKSGWRPLPVLPQDDFLAGNTLAANSGQAIAFARLKEAVLEITRNMPSFNAPFIHEPGCPAGSHSHSPAPICNAQVDADGGEPVICGMPAVLLDPANMEPRCARHADWKPPEGGQ